MVNLVAALASFVIPGLGQLIKGEFSKVVGIWMLLVLATVLTATILGALLGVPLGLTVWIVQFVDAFIG